MLSHTSLLNYQGRLALATSNQTLRYLCKDDVQCCGKKFAITGWTLILFSCLYFLAPLTTLAQTLQPQAHPNHYIVLVDASGSTIETEEKKRLYEKALGERLLTRLYRDGFGPMVPPYDPRQDRLTLHHFGVATGDKATAYARLKNYDLSSDFIHPALVRQGGIEAAALRPMLFPTQSYNYTILAWAKQLALYSSRPAGSGEISQRTFIVTVHDGLSNEGSPEGEAEIVRRHSQHNFQKVKPMVSAIDHDYLFTDSRGESGPAWAEEIRDEAHAGVAPFFLEVYEVIPSADAEWWAKGKQLRPLSDVRLKWTEESGEQPAGMLKGSLSKEFLSWMGAAEEAKVSLGGGLDAKETFLEGLEVPVSFRGALTCRPREFEAALRVSLWRSDKLLGRRALDYTHTQGVTAPAPMRCTTLYVVSLGLGVLLAALFLAALTYYLYYRFRGSLIEIEVPGTMTPVRLERRGRVEGQAPVLPQEGLEALSLRLPSRLQKLLYRKATVTLGTESGEEMLGWATANGTSRLSLAQADGVIPAYWRRLPTTPTEVIISFRQGRQSAEVRLAYPRALTESVTRSANMNENNENKVYVALDLGSESMAAYYETVGGEGGMIRMQGVAKKLRIADPLAFPEDFDLLPEGSNGNASPRLWNRIALNDNVQPPGLEVEHAQLSFVSPPGSVNPELYKRSLFSFFHPPAGWPIVGKVLPNPKIIFQQQVSNILKPIRIDAKGGGYVRLDPELLIKHLTLQVIINFVLNSPEMSDYDRRDIHLTITIPNVYSLPHGESIKSFVRENIDQLAGVEVLSESDAVAYYALKNSDPKNDPPELLRFKKALFDEVEKRREVCIVTIDVGKGTTDLSCVLVQKPRPDSFFGGLIGRSKEGAEAEARRRHSVQGKTGKSSGGNYLNYIFAHYYYNARLKEVVATLPANQRELATFGFIALTGNPQLDNFQIRATAKLEKLIDRVKRSMTADYRIDQQLLSQEEQKEMLEKVVDIMLESVDPSWITDRSLVREEDTGRYNAFKARVVEALILPSNLEDLEEVSSKGKFSKLFGKIFGWPLRALGLRRGTKAPMSPATAVSSGPQSAAGPKPTALTSALKRDIEKYVHENVDELLDSLSTLVEDHQAVLGAHAGLDSGAFVIVSGQGSQFEPLRHAIRKKCNSMSISEIYMMKGVPAKEACCKGVVNFWAAEMLHTNPKELHGTYGCIDAAFDTFKPFDMRKVKNGHTSTISFKESGQGRYYVVFTPRSYREVIDHPPKINDGATALIGVFRGVSEFTIEYVPETLELKVNNRALTISSFGNVDDSIYKKVWPEILKPHED